MVTAVQLAAELYLLRLAEGARPQVQRAMEYHQQCLTMAVTVVQDDR